MTAFQSFAVENAVMATQINTHHLWDQQSWSNGLQYNGGIVWTVLCRHPNSQYK